MIKLILCFVCCSFTLFKIIYHEIFLSNFSVINTVKNPAKSVTISYKMGRTQSYKNTIQPNIQTLLKEYAIVHLYSPTACEQVSPWVWFSHFSSHIFTIIFSFSPSKPCDTAQGETFYLIYLVIYLKRIWGRQFSFVGFQDQVTPLNNIEEKSNTVKKPSNHNKANK